MYTTPTSSIFLCNIKSKLHPHTSDTASSVDVQLEIEASEFLVGVTAYCYVFHDYIVEYIPLTREVN